MDLLTNQIKLLLWRNGLWNFFSFIHRCISYNLSKIETNLLFWLSNNCKLLKQNDRRISAAIVWSTNKWFEKRLTNMILTQLCFVLIIEIIICLHLHMSKKCRVTGYYKETNGNYRMLNISMPYINIQWYIIHKNNKYFVIL